VVSVIDRAQDVARRAAQRAGVDVVELAAAQLIDAQEVIGQVWGPQQVPQHNLLRALSHAGSSLLAAYRAGTCVGVSVGFLGWTPGLHLHSHMTAVSSGNQSRGVGYALKLWQRAVCLEHGVHEIRWTYDPLIGRNAHFNLDKLGAEVVAFEGDFYGAMDDAVNAGDHSDRFEVTWRLDSARVERALSGEQPPRPALGEFVAVPRDYDSLRRTDPGAALQVRLRTRAAFARLMGKGLRPEWADGGYLFGDPHGDGRGAARVTDARR
jgi:predicted GNAT superfamily acetyltransferase